MNAEQTLSAVGAAGLIGLGALVMSHVSPTETRTLSFPADVGADQAVALLGAIAGLPAHTRCWLSAAGIAGEVSFSLDGTKSGLAAIQATSAGVLPGLRFLAPTVASKEQTALRAHVSWRGSHVLLRDDQPELSAAALLGVLRSTLPGERLEVATRLRPIVRPKAPRRRPNKDREPLARVFSPTAEIPLDELRLVRALYGGPLLNARLEVRVWAATPQRARSLLSRTVAVLRARSGRRGRFSARSRRFSAPGVGTTLAPAQLLPLLAWPLDGPTIPGVELHRSPQLLPDRRIPSRGPGRAIGHSTWPGRESQRLVQPVEGTLSHALVLGPTGSGKSTLLTNLLLDEVTGRRGALLLDLKGDTATELLERIPEKRHDDVVILDPSDGRPQPGIKSLGGAAPELAAELWVEIFRGLFADSWGVRTERYLRLGVQTLAYDPGSVITDLPKVFADATFRRQLLKRNGDPFLREGWATFEALSPAQQAEHIAAPLGKVYDILGRRLLRAALGQLNPKMTVARAMRERRIVVVRLAPSLIGGPTAQVLGALVIYELYQAVLARQAIPAAQRVPFAVYVDEPAVLQSLPVPLDSLFDLARGLGVGLTLATQSVEQLPQSVRRAALTNAATFVTFRPNPHDASLMAPYLPPVTAEQLKHLEQFHVVARLGLGHGLVSSTATVQTPPPRPAVPATKGLRDRAARRYGTPATDIEDALRARWEHGDTTSPADRSDTPIGRRRRSS